MTTAFTEEWYEQNQAKRRAERARVAVVPTVGEGGNGIPAGSPVASGGAHPKSCAGPEAVSAHAVGKASAVASALGEISKPKRQIKRPEQDLQIAAVKFLTVALPRDWRVVHVPNGVAANDEKARRANAIRKAMGVRAGFPDLTLLGPGRFAVAEAKAGTGRLRREQEEWRDWFLSIGVPWFVFRSHEELVAGCVDAGIPLRVRGLETIKGGPCEPPLGRMSSTTLNTFTMPDVRKRSVNQGERA